MTTQLSKIAQCAMACAAAHARDDQASARQRQAFVSLARAAGTSRLLALRQAYIDGDVVAVLRVATDVLGDAAFRPALKSAIESLAAGAGMRGAEVAAYGACVRDSCGGADAVSAIVAVERFGAAVIDALLDPGVKAAAEAFLRVTRDNAVGLADALEAVTRTPAKAQATTRAKTQAKTQAKKTTSKASSAARPTPAPAAKRSR